MQEEQKTTDQSGCVGCGCLILLIIVGIFIFSSISKPIVPPPKPTPTPTISPTKETLLTDWELKVLNVEFTEKKLQWSNYGDTKEAAGSWIVLYVSIKNAGSGTSSLSPLNFRLRDSEGNTYNHYRNLAIAEIYALYRGGKSIANDNYIKQGTENRYYLLFDVPTDANGLKLNFLPSLLLQEAKLYELKNLNTQETKLVSNNLANQYVEKKENKELFLKVVDVEYSGKKLLWSNYNDVEEAKGNWLVVSVLVENSGKRYHSLNASNFRIRDSKGITYNHYSDLAVTEAYGRYRGGQSIVNDIISPNGNAKYYLVFDIPPDATALQLEFLPNVLVKSEVISVTPKLLPEKPTVSNQVSAQEKA